VAAHSDDWPLPGRDYRNTRATSDSSIDSSTVASLGVAWEVPLPGGIAYGNASTTPLILGDTVYVQDLTSNVRAIDRATGALRWERLLDSFVIGPNGVAVGWGRLFAVDGTDDLVALDLATGEELWRRRLTRTDSDGIDIQPTVFARLVLASTVPVSLDGIYTGGDRGILQALDVETGELRWEFDTVVDDLWGNPEVNSGGGAWYPPSIDPDGGTVFWGIANPAPFPGTREFPNGSSRPGPNLYTNSVVALDARSGALAWYRQAIPHDIFDRDLVHTLLLEVEEGGRTRTIVVATGKGGRVLGHDLATGELLWETPVGRHENDDLEALEGPTAVWPGTFGGVLTPPSGADGVVYVATLNAPTTLSPDVPAYIGSQIGTAPGEVVAIDARSGAVVWSVEVAGDPLGATTVVNDLVLTATFAGRIYALDRGTGATVWTYDAPGGINDWPAVADDLIVWPVGLARPPRLVALRLGAGP
jgi:glucose dehydrogenase